jgi:hypothetical protein
MAQTLDALTIDAARQCIDVDFFNGRMLGMGRGKRQLLQWQNEWLADAVFDVGKKGIMPMYAQISRETTTTKGGDLVVMDGATELDEAEIKDEVRGKNMMTMLRQSSMTTNNIKRSSSFRKVSVYTLHCT